MEIPRIVLEGRDQLLIRGNMLIRDNDNVLSSHLAPDPFHMHHMVPIYQIAVLRNALLFLEKASFADKCK